MIIVSIVNFTILTLPNLMQEFLAVPGIVHGVIKLTSTATYNGKDILEAPTMIDPMMPFKPKKGIFWSWAPQKVRM